MTIRKETDIYAAKWLDSSNRVYYYLIFSNQAPVNMHPNDTRNCEWQNYSCIEVKNTELISSLESLGVNTQTAIKITGFVAEPVENVPRREIMLDAACSTIVTEDKSFENQYTSCINCCFPVNPITTVNLTQNDIDNFNSGNELHIEKANAQYKCKKCGYFEPRIELRSLHIWKNLGVYQKIQ